MVNLYGRATIHTDELPELNLPGIRLSGRVLAWPRILVNEEGCIEVSMDMIDASLKQL